MESSVALLQTASGLERLMLGSSGSFVKDSTVAQISAFLYYQANVMGKLVTNKQFQMLFRNTIFTQIDKDFGEYVDALSRVKPKSLHHMYEWNKTGQPTARLFKLKQINPNGLSFQIDYDFKLSKTSVPTTNKKQKKKYIFAKKASIMEQGMPIIIRPKSAERLVFEIDGMAVFMPKGDSVTVKSPGGRASSNQFKLAHSIFFSGNMVGASIRKSGFQQIFNRKISDALRVPANIKKVQYSFSSNQIRSQADAALAIAFGGSL